MYDPVMIQPFRDELTILGVRELLTAREVDDAIAANKGTLLAVVNSVCGCAAGRARPGIRLALEHGNKPDGMVSVFAGQDMEATARLRDQYLQGLPPSSPSIALYKGTELVYFMPRYRIEGRMPEQIAADLKNAFDEYCSEKIAV